MDLVTPTLVQRGLLVERENQGGNICLSSASFLPAPRRRSRNRYEKCLAAVMLDREEWQQPPSRWGGGAIIDLARCVCVCVCARAGVCECVYLVCEAYFLKYEKCYSSLTHTVTTPSSSLSLSLALSVCLSVCLSVSLSLCLSVSLVHSHTRVQVERKTRLFNR